MSWFSDFFRNLFGRKPAAPPPSPQYAPQAPPVVPFGGVAYTPPAPVDPAPIPAVPSTPVADLAAPFGRNNYGTPFQSQAEADTWRAAVAARDAELAKAGTLDTSARYHGPVHVDSLNDAEKAYLTYVVQNYKLPGLQNQADVWFAICSGSHSAINLAINQGDPLVKAGGYDPDSYQGRMRGYVDQVARGLLKPVVTH